MTIEEKILPADSLLFEGRPDHEIEQIHASVAAVVADHAEPPLHSIHCRLGLNTTTRQSHWDSNSGIKEATQVQLYGVRGEPFGSASPSVDVKMVIVNPAAQYFFREAELGQEYDVVFFPRPKKTVV